MDGHHRVIDPHVDGTEGVLDCRRARLNLVVIGHVERQHKGLATGLLDLARRSLQPPSPAGDQADPGAVRGDAASGRTADAAAFHRLYVSFDPGFRKRLMGMARSYLRAGTAQRALDLVAKAGALDPEDAEATEQVKALNRAVGASTAMEKIMELRAAESDTAARQ